MTIEPAGLDRRSFTDFPISLGAEWIHVEAEILDEIVNDPSIAVSTQLTSYDPPTSLGTTTVHSSWSQQVTSPT